ncbi:MAG: aldo/keto reductase [Anaerolineales bacterium]|nr:aldo/keto reductase [Anaerolineales bacterium]
MDYRDFGTTGLRVSALGLGAGQIGDENLPEQTVERLLHTALDMGINLIDTARGYGLSEERIGKHLAKRRGEYVLSTKVGYGIPNTQDWTYDCVVHGVEAALQRLNTDYIDIVHLHSCPQSILEQGDVILALERAAQDGKVRVIGYAGDNEPLAYAVRSGRFGSMITSLNICDQRVIDYPLSEAKQRGMGVIAKRPIANAPWRFTERPAGHYGEVYWERWQTMNLNLGMDWQAVALRFAAFTYGVDSCIVGTTSLEHLRANVAILEDGPLDTAIVDTLRAAFRQHDNQWLGQV